MTSLAVGGARGETCLTAQVSECRAAAGFLKPQRHKPDVTSCCPKMSRSDRKEDSGRKYQTKKKNNKKEKKKKKKTRDQAVCE